MVDDAHLHRLQADRNLLADTAEAEDADGLGVELDLQRVAALQPLAFTDETVGLRQLPGEGNHQADGDLGHGVVQHVGGVGDVDVPLLGGLGVDRVVADTEIGDHLELWQAIHQLGGDVAASDGTQPGSKLGDERVLVGRLVQLVYGEALGQHLLAAVEQLVGLENFVSHLFVPRSWAPL